MKIDRYSKTGRYHKESGGKNEDYLYGMENEDCIAIMLADGASSAQRGLEGAALSCETMAEVVENEGASFFSSPDEKLAYLLTEQILYGLECNMDAGADIREYASTFILAYMEKKTGRAVLANLGDGAVLSVKENGVSFLLEPKKYRGNPCLTTTKDAYKAAEIRRVQIAFGQSIVLCSDGFLDVSGSKEAAESLRGYDIPALNSALDAADTFDDCSYISFMRTRNRPDLIND